MPVCMLEPLTPPPQPPPPHSAAAKPPPIIHPSTSAAASAPILLQQPPPSPASLSSPPSPRPRDDCAACPHCQEEYGGARPVYWRIQLDRDLLETILSIYPEWFKDCNLEALKMSEASSSSGGGGGAAPGTPGSPPKAEVDDSPLQRCMDKNKESLKVKLMLRRPINQLVAQGIMPPLKTPPAFHEQRQKLERAKTGDLLKAKIQQRPDRQELVRQHILEDVGHVDPSLAERQRMLKKARLQDSLNDQLSHRPGPLELIKKNILHTDETIERAVKEGQIPFRATCEGHLTKPQHPSRYITLEEDSMSSEGGQSPPQTLAPLSAPTTPALLQGQTLLLPVCLDSVVVPVSVVPCPAPSPSLASSLSSLSPASSVASPPAAPQQPPLSSLLTSAAPLLSLAPPPPPPLPSPAAAAVPPPPPPTPISISPVALTAPTAAALAATQPRPLSRAEKEQHKNRKKSKTKTQPKARTIKFHEYKGPPNAHKSNNSPPPVETSYELLLQQQQLFLQWQLEWQHKYPQIILPAAQKPVPGSPDLTSTLPNLITVTTTSAAPSPLPTLLSQQPLSAAPSPAPSLASPAPPATPSLPPPTPEPVRAISKLEDMKVNDLKAELKKRNLPVSGSKPQLIERLRPFSEQMGLEQPPTPSSVCSNPKSVGTLALGEDSLSGLSSMDTPNSPMGGEGSLLSLEQCLSSPGGGEENSNSSAANTSLPPSPLSVSQPPLMSPDAAADMDVDMEMELAATMDTSGPDAAASPDSDDIISLQQRQIEQLQRELHKSQLQLHKIKEAAGQPLDTSTKNQLQQHLQHKMQQQRLQAQLQQLQQLQTLQQQQHAAAKQAVAAAAAATVQPQAAVSPAAAAQSVKASLAAFLQAQHLTGQQQQPLVLQIATLNNNNNTNNNNNNDNNNKNKAMLHKQQKLNQINLLQKQRSNSQSQASQQQQHSRTASLPNFFGSFVQQSTTTTPVAPPVIQMAAPKAASPKSETQFVIASKPPPPLYEEATKFLKVHINKEPNSNKHKHIKSQIVEDVLEILIKNGELPPSAAQVPVTPTTPGQATAHGLVFKAEAPKPPTPPPLPPAATCSTDADLPFTLNLQSMLEESMAGLTESKGDSSPEEADGTFAMSQLDMILGQTGNNPQPISVAPSNLIEASSGLSNPSVELKDLGLDLETLDFGHLEPIKLEGSELLQEDKEEPMEGVVSSGGGGGEVPMDLDVSDWLEALLPPSSPPSLPLPSHHPLHLQQRATVAPPPPTDLDTYDPLLSTSQDVFDLFSLEDADLKMPLSWDKVDFAA